MTKVTSQGEAYPIISLAGRAESIPLSQSDLPANIAANGTYTSPLILADGFYNLIVGATSDRAGALNVQRYIDEAGLVPVGAADTIALVANTAKVLKINDSVPFGSYKVIITNTDGSNPAIITAFAMRSTSN